MWKDGSVAFVDLIKSVGIDVLVHPRVTLHCVKSVPEKLSIVVPSVHELQEGFSSKSARSFRN